MKDPATRWIWAVSFICAAAGFLLPWWPLSVVGILLAAFAGRYFFAIALGLLLDVAYGAPVGRWHVLYFPFALLGIAAAAVRYWGVRYVRRGPRDTL